MSIGFAIEFVDDFFKDGITGLVAINFYEQAERFIMLQDWKGFFAKFLKTSLENFKIFIVSAIAAIADFLGFAKTVFNIGFGDIKDDGGFNVVTSAGGDRYDLIFFAVPTTDGG